MIKKVPQSRDETKEIKKIHIIKWGIFNVVSNKEKKIPTTKLQTLYHYPQWKVDAETR